MYHYEPILEFDKLKKQWSVYAMTQAAQKRIASAEPYHKESDLRAELRETTEAKELLEKYGNPPLVSLTGIQEMVDAAVRGECLSAGELEGFAKALVAVRRLKGYLVRCKGQTQSLPYYEENLDAQELLAGEIEYKVRGGAVYDNATKLLRSLRTEIEHAEQAMREKADAVIRANKELMSDCFCTIRGGRICVPVKKEYKFRISGSVVDKSATGNTVFVEPAAVAKYYEELVALRLDEEAEVRRILYELTAQVADIADIMHENIRMIEKLDYIFSKGKISLVYDGTEPDINLDGKIVIEDGRHPLMEKTSCVPLHFELGGQIKGIVITGPNTGGKTVALKTVALACLMAQCGLHVACKKADLCMRSNYLCDIGDGQSISENLSTFSAHIKNVLDILRHTNKDSLIVMDELGSGTDPTEGMGLAVAILEELVKSGALFVVTTHYPEVKQYAKQQNGIQNARMAFDKETLCPTYNLELGEAGESCAFYIAEKLGMPKTMLENAARAAYNTTEKCCEIDYDFSMAVQEIKKEAAPKLERKEKQILAKQLGEKFHLGDSVMVYPDKKLAIVCKPMDEKGVLRVQLQNKKIWINHKRVKLVVAAKELYPPDYDFSILFDTVENRKLRHQMERKYMENTAIKSEE